MIILAAVGVWLPGMRGNYFLADDFTNIQFWGMAPLWQWFTREFFGFYRPLTALLFRVDYLFWELEPFGYYLTNLLLHGGCTLLVWWIARQLFPRRAGMWAGLLFIFMPGHVFGVLLIAARTGLLCTLFYLASIALYLHGRAKGRCFEVLSLMAFALALLSKELAVSLPLLILTWEIISDAADRRVEIRRWTRNALPYFAVLTGYLVLRYTLFGHLSYNPLLHTNLDPLNLFVNAARVTAAVLAPWGLEDLKPLFRTYPHGLVIATLIGSLIGVVLLYRFRGRMEARHLLCLAWIGVTMLPVLRIFSPWNTYLPSAAAAMLIAGVVSGGSDRAKRSTQREAFLAGLVVLFVVYSVRHQGHWRDAGSLCRQVLDAVVRTSEERPDGFYLANLPTELGEAPVFGGFWGLQSGMKVREVTAHVEALAQVRKSVVEERSRAVVTGDQTFTLTLAHPDEFFRLEIAEILTRRIRPEVGYAYAEGDARITITALNRQSQPGQIEIDMGSPERLRRVMIWNGRELVPLLQK